MPLFLSARLAFRLESSADVVAGVSLTDSLKVDSGPSSDLFSVCKHHVSSSIYSSYQSEEIAFWEDKLRQIWVFSEKIIQRKHPSRNKWELLTLYLVARHLMHC